MAGARLGAITLPATRTGYQEMEAWAQSFGYHGAGSAARHWRRTVSRRDGVGSGMRSGFGVLGCGPWHYAGGAVLHWDRGPGMLLSGDILQVAPDRQHISVLRSYPNMLPVSGPAIERIEAVLAPYAYDAIYGAFNGREIPSDAKRAVAVSLHRYLDAIRGDGSAERL